MKPLKLDLHVSPHRDRAGRSHQRDALSFIGVQFRNGLCQSCRYVHEFTFHLAGSASVAQLVELGLENAWVQGSSPWGSLYYPSVFFFGAWGSHLLGFSSGCMPVTNVVVALGYGLWYTGMCYGFADFVNAFSRQSHTSSSTSLIRCASLACVMALRILSTLLLTHHTLCQHFFHILYYIDMC